MSETQNNDAYLAAPQVTFNPGPEHRAASRKFQGISSVAVAADGNLWATWYGGKTPGEDKNNYVILAKGSADGTSWSDEKVIVDPDGEGPVRAYDPEVWKSPDGKLWLFWAQGMSDNRRNTKTGTWAITSDDNGSSWSEPRRLCDGVMMCKPVVLSTGEWALPVSHWDNPVEGSAMYVSTDGGKTFTFRGGTTIPADLHTYDEHMIVEKKDGSLWMLIRTKAGIGESFSKDGGKTWSDLQKVDIEHTPTRFFIRRLASGRLLWVRHDATQLKDRDPEKRIPRSHLTAYLSDDDGKTWPHSMLLDERETVSYPDGDQTEDGRIFVTYDFQRKDDRTILLSSFTEDDIIAGGGDAKLRMLINKATG